MSTIKNLLEDFATKNKMSSKGPLCVALIVTRHARELGLPLDPNYLFTPGGGQVFGLGKSSVQKILKEHGITRVLAEEGGRTSRGSVGNMRKYVVFLNDMQERGLDDLGEIESFWVERVKLYFASKPFVLRFDTSKSLRSVIKDLIEQAQKRQAESSGSMVVGTMLQHLTGAKLNLLLGPNVKHHGASVADQPSGRSGDFLIEDVAIHVTTLPGEALIRKCKSNLDSGLRPVIITTAKGDIVAQALAENEGILSRIDIFEAEQFLAGNMYEIGKFAEVGRRITTEKLINEYNDIVSACETDPSLRISFS